MRVDRPLKGHRREAAVMGVAKNLRDAGSDRSNVFWLSFAGLTILTNFVAHFPAPFERSARLDQDGDMHKNNCRHFLA